MKPKLHMYKPADINKLHILLLFANRYLFLTWQLGKKIRETILPVKLSGKKMSQYTIFLGSKISKSAPTIFSVKLNEV